MAAASPSLVDIDKVEEDIRYCEEYLAHDSALHAAHLPTEYDTQRDSLVADLNAAGADGKDEEGVDVFVDRLLQNHQPEDMHDARVRELLEQHQRRVAEAGTAATTTASAANPQPPSAGREATASPSRRTSQRANVVPPRPASASGDRKTMARRLLDEEERECTFRPKVNSNYKAKVKDDAPRTREERLQKLSKDRAATLKKVEALRIEAERREASECTFRPKINRGSPAAAKPVDGKGKAKGQGKAADSGARSKNKSTASTERVEDRLLKDYQQTLALREAARAALIDRESEECTFKPETNVGRRKAWGTAKAAALLAAKSPSNSSSFATPNMGAAFVLSPESAAPESSKASPDPSSSSSPDTRPIHQRLGDLQRKRNERLMQAKMTLEKEELAEFSFRPKINENSAKIAKRVKPAEPLHRRQTRASSGVNDGVAPHEECTFSPETNPYSEQILQTSNRGMTFEERQEHIRRESVAKRLQGAKSYKDPHCTFRPDTGNAAQVLSSSRHAARVTETVEERAERLANADKKYLDSVRRSVSEDYYRQLTFKPEVHEYPGYTAAKNSYMSSVDQLHADTVRRRRAEEARERAEAEMRRTCTFRPKISKASKALADKNGGSTRAVDYLNPGAVLKDIAARKSEREAALEAKRREMEELEQKECVFTPSIGEKWTPPPSAPSGDEPMSRPMTVVRGLQRHLDLRIRAKEQAEEQAERERRAFLLDAARRPAQVGSTKVEAFSLVAGAAANERARRRMKHLEEESRAREREECTFRPKTLEGRNRELIRRMLNDNAASVDDSLLYAVNGFSA